MEIRKAKLEELSVLMDLFEGAKIFMREQGNATQWTDGYPFEELVKEDIETGCAYVCLQNEVIVGTFVYRIGEDPTYKVIYEGAWPDNKPYGVVHRLASKRGVHGVGVCCFDWALQQLPVLRVDTHADNQVMRNLLTKYGFTYCGIIYLEHQRGERLAYHISRE